MQHALPLSHKKTFCAVYRVNVPELEEVFAQQNGGEYKTDTEGKNGEGDACLDLPKADEEETSLEREVLN